MRQTDAEYWKILDFTLLSGRLPTPTTTQRPHGRRASTPVDRAQAVPGQPYLGQKISVGGQMFEVIGVVEDEMHVNAYADIWAPVTPSAVDRLPGTPAVSPR
jgi:putative ABC transport system permease protein